MKVACISASQVPSTVANSMQVMKACQAIRQLGHEMRLFVPAQAEGEPQLDLRKYYGLTTPIDIEWLPSRKSLHRYDLATHAVRQARNMQADVCYVWPIQAAIFSLLAGIPVVIELHGPPEGRFGPSLFRLFLRLEGWKRLLPITSALAGQLQEHYPINKNLVVVSPNGVDLERYSNLPDPSTSRTQLGLPVGITAGYTGHLYPGRGMNLLIELAKRFRQVNFLWVGGKPPDVASWKEQLASDNVSNITFTGFVENSRLPLFQAAADILLMPYEGVISGSSGGDSSSYASPMKMFEYMASNRPILSSDLPVIREVLNPANAVLCPPGDVESWSRALKSLVEDPEQRQRLAQQAWQDVQGYTWRERGRKALDGFEKPLPV